MSWFPQTRRDGSRGAHYKSLIGMETSCPVPIWHSQQFFAEVRFKSLIDLEAERPSGRKGASHLVRHESATALRPQKARARTPESKQGIWINCWPKVTGCWSQGPAPCS